jgi:signal transduction histidine kinase
VRKVIVAAAVLFLGVGGLCAAWYISSQRAFDAEVRLRSQQAVRTAGERERSVAESLGQRLETLRRSESQRPYFHYQNLYHDPKGASEGLSVTPSPLAGGPGNPLVTAHFQIDARGQVTLPTLNDELRELNAPDAVRQRALQAMLARSAVEVVAAADPLVQRVQQEAAAARATATRIAQLEAKLEAVRSPAPSQLQVLDNSAFVQNVNSNIVYQQLKENRAAAPALVPRGAPPVEIRTSDLEWRTLQIDGKPRLVALRAVHTPSGTIVQGMLTALSDGAAVEGAVVRRSMQGSAIEGTGWRVRLPADPFAPVPERERFLPTFVGICSLLALVILGVTWTLWRAEKLATDRTRFAATAAHELRTPLASLRLYSDLIAEEEDAGKRERYARELASQTERLGRVVANVLEVTRIERGTFALHPRPGAIGPAVEACVDRLRPQMEAARCPIELHVAQGLPDVAFDADAIHHVVDNLVDNAEKFSRDVIDRSISVAVAAEEGGVAITVTDCGPGVAAELFREPKAFRRGTSAPAPAGLGLGLFLVDRIVRGHGGVMGSSRADRGGASVRVFLPAFYKP